ncbi:MAG: ABC transporter ATP-binding protein [bacterium]|nr:ABC transporter ATP-binding protein [bacterium]
MGLLWSFYKRFLRYKGALLAGFVSIPLAQAADVYITVLIGGALQDARTATDASFMQRVVLLLGLAAVANCVLMFVRRWCIVVVSRRVEVDLKQELFDRLTSLPFAYHNKSRSGDVVSRLTSDVENLRMFLGPGLMYAAGAAVIVPISMVLLFRLNAPLAATMVMPMVGMGLTMKLLTPRLHKHSVAVQESLADISHRAQENFAGIRVVKGYSREDSQASRFEATSQDNRENQIHLGHARGLTHAAVNGAFDLTFVVILVIGGLAAVDASLPLGNLFIFIDLTFKVFWPLIALGWIAGMYPRALASAERVNELLSEVSSIRDPQSPAPLPELEGALSLTDVGFTYKGALHPALHAIDLEVPAGGTVGVVGPTGSGKTTLLNLLGRLYEAEGEIRLDGVPIRDLTLSDLRGALGYVPQDSFLFSAPYDENVRFGADRDLSDEEVAQLTARAAMADEVAEFPDGVSQLIGERGVTLSGGQRQRTCIARALARDPKILILDDCLSAVDTETEQMLVDNLRQAGEGRTVVLSAHRLSTVRSADRILVLSSAGEVEATGTHDELIGEEGWYRTTWQQQQRRKELKGELE